MSPVDPFTRTEHSGELLVAEARPGWGGLRRRDRLRRLRLSAVHGAVRVGAGRLHGWEEAYTRGWAERYPDQLRYVHDALPPADAGLARGLAAELDAGALGVKIFPAYLRLDPGAPEIRAAFDVLRERGRAAVFGFEDTAPPETPSLAEYYEAIGRLAADYADVPIQLNHGANAHPDGPEFPVLRGVVAASPSVLVSTSVSGAAHGVGGRLAPPSGYLGKLARYADAIPPGQLAWATDWPWFEGQVKYPRSLAAVAEHGSFPSEESRRMYLGANALRHWRL